MRFVFIAALAVFAALFLIPAGSASAYVDPASGSTIVGAIIGALVAAGLFFKSFWYKIKNLFKGGGAKAAESETPPQDD